MSKRIAFERSMDDESIFPDDVLKPILKELLNSPKQICTLLRVCKRWERLVLVMVDTEPMISMAKFFSKYAFTQAEGTTLYLDVLPHGIRLCIKDIQIEEPGSDGEPGSRTLEFSAFVQDGKRWDQGVTVRVNSLFPDIDWNDADYDEWELSPEEFANEVHSVVLKRNDKGGVYVDARMWNEYSRDSIIKRVYNSPHTKKLEWGGVFKQQAYYLSWKHFEERIASDEIQWTLRYGKYR